MEVKDYSKRTSRTHDDREGDTVTRLDGGLIKVCEGEAPKMAFFLIPKGSSEEAGTPSTNLEVEGYVRMAALSKETRDRIRSDLGLSPPDSSKALRLLKIG